MKKITLLTILISICCLQSAFASATDSTFTETPVILHTATGDLFGYLTTPMGVSEMPVALIIAGSGPTDRNGNGWDLQTDNLKKLAYYLAGKNIATVRYDKRGIAASAASGEKEEDLRFDTYINDAKDWITLLKNDRRFTKVFVIGHSEGSQIGMVAALSRADGFVSIAGPGRTIDKILRWQLSGEEDSVRTTCYAIMDSLFQGNLVYQVPEYLSGLFRLSVQPYMISWNQHDPVVDIAKLQIPVLIVQGTNDIQITVEDAKALAAANPKAELVLITNMNHLFRILEGDREANLKTYNEPELPISEELCKAVSDFILKH